MKPPEPEIVQTFRSVCAEHSTFAACTLVAIVDRDAEIARLRDENARLRHQNGILLDAVRLYKRLHLAAVPRLTDRIRPHAEQARQE